MSGNYRKKDVTTITISHDTRETLRQLQEKYHLEVDDAMKLLLYIYQQVGKEYDICVSDTVNPSPPTLA
jgi:hypothetical protein